MDSPLASYDEMVAQLSAIVNTAKARSMERDDKTRDRLDVLFTEAETHEKGLSRRMVAALEERRRLMQRLNALQAKYDAQLHTHQSGAVEVTQ